MTLRVADRNEKAGIAGFFFATRLGLLASEHNRTRDITAGLARDGVADGEIGLVLVAAHSLCEESTRRRQVHAYNASIGMLSYICLRRIISSSSYRYIFATTL